jgi:hypothetical protein
MSTFKQEHIDRVVREIESKSLQGIAFIILNERFEKKITEYERNWLDNLADILRDGDSFNEMTLMNEHYNDPKKELIKRYMNE